MGSRICDEASCRERATEAEVWRTPAGLAAVVKFCREHHEQSINETLEAVDAKEHQ